MDNTTRKAIERLITCYEILLETNGAQVPLDGQGLIKAGDWLRNGLESEIIRLRELLTVQA